MDILKPVLIAADHAGYDLKNALQRLLPEWKWQDLGPFSTDRVDYPDFAAAVARKIVDGEAEFGILVCGSGIGMCIAANKFRGIRAAGADNPVSARLAREHNDANILCLGSRFLAPEYAAELARTFLSTPFPGDPRHKGRIQKITKLET